MPWLAKMPNPCLRKIRPRHPRGDEAGPERRLAWAPAATAHARPEAGRQLWYRKPVHLAAIACLRPVTGRRNAP